MQPLTTHVCPLCNKEGPTKKEKSVVNLETNELIDFKTLNAAITIFSCIKDEIKSLFEKKYLPKIKMLNVPTYQTEYLPNLDNLLRLCFLSTIRKGDHKIPVTKVAAGIFSDSQTANEKTSKWLGFRAITSYVGLGLCAAAVNYISLLTLIKITSPINETYNNSTASQAWNQMFYSSMVFLPSAVISVATNLAGLWWTGRNPDNSSIRANEQQNHIRFLRDDYLDLCYELISLYFDEKCHSLANMIADEVNVPLIENILNAATDDKHASKAVGLDKLLSVIHFIQSKGKFLPRDKDLQAYIRNQKKQNQII